MYDTRDTIAAIATAPGATARAIVRLSGPDTRSILKRLFRPGDGRVLDEVKTPTVIGGSIPLPSTRIDLPVDLYFWPGLRSYTRQPLAELHTLGSPPLVAALVEAACKRGARLAKPGEFTLRAFLAGRLDLAQAEAVMAVVDARGPLELDRALAQLAGGLAQPLAEVRDQLLNLLADLEAGLDFVDEDIEFVSREQIAGTLAEALSRLDAITARSRARNRDDSLPRVALVGRANVGKSSLFNALVPAGTALISSSPGTTRDYLTATLDTGEIRCQLIDTAGTAPADDAIAQAAQDAAAREAAECDLRLLCIDASRPLVPWEQEMVQSNPDDRQLVVLTKCDLPRRAELPCPALVTSVRPSHGLAEVRQAIARAVGDLTRAADEASGVAQQCFQSMHRARAALDRAHGLVVDGRGDELVAGEVRTALEALGEVAGAVYTDDLLDRVFSRFCIGK